MDRESKAFAECAKLATVAFSHDDLALRFTERHLDHVRYVAQWDRWMWFEGSHWKEDSTLRAYDAARAISKEVALEAKIEEREGLAKQLCAATTIAAVERMAASDQRTAAVVDQWDSHPWQLNTPGGTVDLATGELRPHRMGDYHTKLTGVALPEAAECPLWRKFLDRITGGNPELQAYLQRVAGYSLTGSTREEALFFLYGTGANGKGTFTTTLLGVVGNYGQIGNIETFAETATEHHPTDRAALRGARLVVVTETQAGNYWNESRLKALTGGDRIRARFMRCDEFEFTPQFKPMIQGNHKPALRNVDEAIRRRFHLIPFTVTIPLEERDRDLKEKLKAEYPGILRWAVDGCLEWQKQGLNAPAAVVEATEEYLTTEDAICSWLEERAIVTPQAAAVRSSVLYADFKRWAEAANESALSQKKFSQALQDRGFSIRRNNGSVVDGIRLRDE